jgi:hypothetical protein
MIRIVAFLFFVGCTAVFGLLHLRQVRQAQKRKRYLTERIGCAGITNKG